MNPNKQLIAQFFAICESLNWNVSIESQEPNETTFELQRYSTYGQDFFFFATYEHDNERSLYRSILDFYESYDTDAETALWIDDCGHGRNGAPHRLSDILADMQEIEAELEKLTDAVLEIC